MRQQKESPTESVLISTSAGAVILTKKKKFLLLVETVINSFLYTFDPEFGGSQFAFPPRSPKETEALAWRKTILQNISTGTE